MLKLDELKELIELIDASSITEFKYEVDGSVVKLKKQVEVVQVKQTQEIQNSQTTQVTEQQSLTSVAPVQTEAKTINDDKNIVQILSPMVGTFYTKPSPENDSYVDIGATVNENSVVCIVEAMKLFNEIEAEINGEIVEILAEDGQLVEFGQPLFKVKTK